MELGFYDCGADYSINLQTPTQETFSTVFHELTHMLITLQSGYGTFLHILKVIKSIDNKYDYIYDFFFMHMTKMQEACSTFSELIFILIGKNCNNVSDKIKEMKLFNSRYYNFVSPLLFVLKYVDCRIESSYSFKIPIAEIYNIVKEIAIKSCEVDLTEIPYEYFKNKKSLEKIANIDELVRTYLPNKRFKIAVKELNKQLNIYSKQLYSEEKMALILQDVYSAAFKCNFVKDYSTTDDYKRQLEEIVQKNKLFILELYKDSKDYGIILDRTTDITVKEMSIERLPAYSIPFSINKQYNFQRLCNSVQELNSTFPSIYFVLGDGKTIQESFKKPKNENVNIAKKFQTIAKEMSLQYGFYTLINNMKFKSNILIVLAYNYETKSINSAIIEKKEIVLFDSKVPIVVNYKHYHEFREYSASLNQDVFIYCDRTYENTIPIINELACESSLKYNLISYTQDDKDISLAVLIVKIKAHHYFLLPVVRSVEFLIALDSKQGKIRIEPLLELDQNLIDIIDAILNNLYFF